MVASIFKEFKVKQDHKERLISVPSLPFVLKLDRKAYFPHIQHPFVPNTADGGLPIGAYTEDKGTHSCDYQYKGCPEPWPNPLSSKAFSLYPPGVPMPYSSSYASVLRKPRAPLIPDCGGELYYHSRARDTGP